MKLTESILHNLKESERYSKEQISYSPTGKKREYTLSDKDLKMFNDATDMVEGFGLDFSNAKVYVLASAFGPSKKIGDYKVSLEFGDYGDGPAKTMNIVYKDQESFPEEWNQIISKVGEENFSDNIIFIPLSRKTLIKKSIDLINK